MQEAQRRTTNIHTVLGGLDLLHPSCDFCHFGFPASQTLSFPPDLAVGVKNFLASGYRAVTIMPMLRAGEAIGLLSVVRMEPGALSDKQRSTLKAFADQAVIAIENARLLNELRQRTDDLSESLEQQTATSGILEVISNSPTDTQPAFDAIVQSGATLFPGAAVVISLPDGNLVRAAAVAGADPASAAAIKSRYPLPLTHDYVTSSAILDRQEIDISDRESAPIKLSVGVENFLQEITRVLLNLVSNGFYAATKHKAETNGGDYEPTLAAATKNRGDRVEITIRDNGTGIPPEVKDKMFNPFFTTKPAGEGTGLGLSLSHDIIVKQHAGTIEVETEPGRYTEFRIILPRAAATIAKSGGRM